MSSQTYHIKTFGCQMNISDSERIDTFMLSNGFLPSEQISKAKIVIINTCGVRQMAEDRVFGMVRNLKKNNPEIKIIITGCLANRKDIHRRMKGVDIFTEIKEFPNSLKKIIIPLKQNISQKNNSNCELQFTNNPTNKNKADYLSIKPTRRNNFQAHVPIMTGCNNFCSYCVVPYARGREVSRPANEIISEIKNLIKTGYKSIVLLGQNVNSYKDNSTEKSIDFPSLLKKINSIPGKFWIHFVSSHPKNMNSDAIEAITGLKKVCENVHLPIQAGDNEILQKMNRNYTREDYLRLISRIKKSFKKNKPGVPYSITTDIIVGFPGETKKRFENSVLVMKKSKFDMVFFGQYSPRPKTAAWNMKDDVSLEEKKTREKTLNEILKKTNFANNKKYIGKKIELLVEKEKNGIYFGKTRTLKNVRLISAKKNLIGKIIPIQITKANVWNLEAKICQ